MAELSERFTDPIAGGEYRNGRIIHVVKGKEVDVGPVPARITQGIQEYERQQALRSDVQIAADEREMEYGLTKLFGAGWEART